MIDKIKADYVIGVAQHYGVHSVFFICACACMTLQTRIWYSLTFKYWNLCKFLRWWIQWLIGKYMHKTKRNQIESNRTTMSSAFNSHRSIGFEKSTHKHTNTWKKIDREREKWRRRDVYSVEYLSVEYIFCKSYMAWLNVVLLPWSWCFFLSVFGFRFL